MQFSSATSYFTLLGSKYSTWHLGLKPLHGEGYLYEMGPHITDSYLLLPNQPQYRYHNEQGYNNVACILLTFTIATHFLIGVVERNERFRPFGINY